MYFMLVSNLCCASMYMILHQICVMLSALFPGAACPAVLQQNLLNDNCLFC